MAAKRSYKKGETVRSERCEPVASMLNKVPVCSRCLIYLVTGLFSDSLIHCDKERCSDTVYCSNQCRDAHYKQHNLLCRRDKYTNQFYKYAYKCANERMIHTLHLINSLILKVNGNNDANLSDDEAFRCQFADSLFLFLNEYDTSNSRGDAMVDLEESYLYLKSLLLYDTKIFPVIKQVISVVTIDVYNKLMVIAGQYMLPVITNTPVLDTARNIIKMKTIDERVSAFNSLIGFCQSDVKIKIGYRKDCEYTHLEYDRLITQFVNLVSSGSALTAPSMFQGLFYILIPPSQLLTHSCAYNTVTELVQSSETPLMQYIALYDINEGDGIYMNNKPQGADCSCSWCWYQKLGFDKFISVENQVKFNYSADSATLLTIAHTSMQQGRETSGVQLYQYLLAQHLQKTNNNSKLGILYHTLGSALLNMPDSAQRELLCGTRVTRWTESYECFKAGFDADPTNNELLELNEKLVLLPVRSFSSNEIRKYIGNNSDHYTVLVEKQIYIFKDPYVVSNDECNSITKEAEEYASVNSWTTTRHPFVPTTDIPVHKIPKVLAWFNTFMDTKVIPLLIQQYIPESASSCRIGIHDAFVVKYEASNQRSLPLHTDQSTHSLIIALNDDTEYVGGGTYFKKLDKSYRLQKGEILSFPGGGLEHAGDPLSRGTRYIIAVFLFIDFSDNKRKHADVERVRKLEVDAEAGQFRFNFNDN